jgi:hypothetical protein
MTLSGDYGVTFPDSTTQISNANPQVTIYASGSGTYTTPTNCKYLTVEMVGAGGGGGGSGNSNAGATGGTGGTTTFGTSLLTCTGGGPGQNGGLGTAGGTAGTATLNSPATGLATIGNRGFGYQGYNIQVSYTAGPLGGISPMGSSNITSGSGKGAGGSGGGCDATAGLLGTAGGSGGYINAVITNPSASYSYAVGAAGTAGGAGTGGNVGIAGGAGYIIVTAYF